LLRIGITGGIGSGKSTVARIFNTLGIPVYDSDEASKRLMAEDEELKKNITRHFGESSYINGELNRKYLSEQVFNDPQKLEFLNSLVHPPTIQDADRWMQKQNTSYAIKEAALIFESGSHKQLDYVIGVKAPAELRIRRTMQRNHITREQVLARMSRQMDEEEKMNLCDFIIVNDEQQMLIPQVLALHSRLLSLAGSK
jgi:dephospho-CoA kinase